MSLQAQCVRSMRTGVRSRRIGKQPSGAALQQFGPEAQRMIRRMAHAEHPLIAAHASARCAAPGRPASGKPRRDRRRPARWKCASLGPSVFCTVRKLFDRLLEPALQQMLVALERNHARCASAGASPGR